jgi:hypothetical protein
VDIIVGQLRNARVQKSKDEKEVTIALNEVDGNFYGTWNLIKMPAKSFEMLQEAVVEDWLEKKKSLIQE